MPNRAKPTYAQSREASAKADAAAFSHTVDTLRNEISGNKNKAIDLLNKAGIVDKKGNLTKPYK